MAVPKPIWPGSSSFFPGDTPFGYYDNDLQFQNDAFTFELRSREGKTWDKQVIELNCGSTYQYI